LKKILLIEDEPLIQRSLKKILEKKGASVSVESSGKSAINNILQNDFDTIICDLMLQDTTGFDVIEESKKKYNAQEISNKFIIITAYSSPQVHEKANGYGCQVIGKPFEDMENAISIFLREEHTK
jgi:CheY-like chemotaxis protein